MSRVTSNFNVQYQRRSIYPVVPTLSVPPLCVKFLCSYPLKQSNQLHLSRERPPDPQLQSFTQWKKMQSIDISTSLAPVHKCHVSNRNLCSILSLFGDINLDPELNVFGLKPELDIFSYDILTPSFRDFSRLPPELRAKVLQYTFPSTPRTFYLAADPITFELQIRTFSQLPRDLAITLQINQESRGETFRAYDTCIPYARSSWYHHRTAYVNFNVDIFWFEGCEESINVPTISSDPSADSMGPDTVIS